MIFLLEIFQGCFTVQLSMSCCPFRDSSFSVSLCELLVKDFFSFSSWKTFTSRKIFSVALSGDLFIILRCRLFVKHFLKLFSKAAADETEKEGFEPSRRC